MSNDDVLAEIARSQDQTIVRMRRVLYVGPDQTISTHGPIEISFASAAILFLKSGPDGEALSAEPAPWVDPFQEPMTEENRPFVGRSGKWTAFDVTEQAPYSRLVCHPVSRLMLVTTLQGKITGVMLQAAGVQLHVQVDGDELTASVV